MNARIVLAAFAAVLVAAAAQKPETLGPPVTGTMYNGNNVNPPHLAPNAQQASNANSAPMEQGEQTTGAQNRGGRTASAGGGN